MRPCLFSRYCFLFVWFPYVCLLAEDKASSPGNGFLFLFVFSFKCSASCSFSGCVFCVSRFVVYVVRVSVCRCSFSLLGVVLVVVFFMFRF